MHLAVSIAWLFLIRRDLGWAAAILSEPDSRLNAGLVFTFALVVGIRAYRRRHTYRRPPLRAGVLLAVLVVAVAHVLVERYVPIHRFAVVVAGVGTHMVLGLWLAPTAWRAALPATMVLVASLPFATQLEVYAGFPARLVTTEVAARLLSALGAHGTTRETLLVFESGIAQVDLPCSGMRSLWSGAVLSLGAAVLGRRRLDSTWLVHQALYVAALLAGNALRITTIVGLGVALGARDIAEAIHEPLGVGTFIAASLGYLALQRQRAAPVAAAPSLELPRLAPRPRRAALRGVVVAASLVALGGWSGPLPAAPVRSDLAIILPAGFVTERLPLTEAEERFFGQGGVVHASKHRVVAAALGVHGSFVIVASDTFRAQHQPDECFTSLGLQPVQRETVLLDDGMRARALGFADRGRSGLYWFQSARQTTEDFSARVFAELGGERRWVQVSVLLEEPVTAEARAQLATVLRQSVAQTFFAEALAASVGAPRE